MKYIFSAFVQFFLYTIFHVKSLSRKWRHNSFSQTTLSWNTEERTPASDKTCFVFMLDRIPCLRISTHFWAEQKQNTQSSSSKPSKYFGICPLCSFPIRYIETGCSVGSALHICKILALSLQCNLPSFWVSIKRSSLNWSCCQNRMT